MSDRPRSSKPFASCAKLAPGLTPRSPDFPLRSGSVGKRRGDRPIPSWPPSGTAARIRRSGGKGLVERPAKAEASRCKSATPADAESLNGTAGLERRPYAGVLLMTRSVLGASAEEILDLNPQIDRQVVRRWRRLNEQIIRLGGESFAVGSEYRIDPPFGTLKRTPTSPDTPREIHVSRSGGHFAYVRLTKPAPRQPADPDN